MPLDWTGVAGKIADTPQRGDRGEPDARGRAGAREPRSWAKRASSLSESHCGGPTGSGGTIQSVNSLIEDLVRPTSEMQRVIGAVADGDLSKKITADVHGEMLELKNTINAMVDQLNGFVSEVTRVAARSAPRASSGRPPR
jgi:hypothetical protein